MAFIKEFISERDKRRVSFDEITKSMGWRQRPTSWVVDEETGSFLIIMFWGDAVDQSGEKYAFSWKGCPVYFAGDASAETTGDGLCYVFRARAKPRLPEEMESEREAIYENFKKALVVDKGPGYARVDAYMI